MTEILDSNGTRITVGARVLDANGNEEGTVVDLTEPDGDVNEYGRAVPVGPYVTVQYDDDNDGDTVRYTALWNATGPWDDHRTDYTCDDVTVAPSAQEFAALVRRTQDAEARIAELERDLDECGKTLLSQTEAFETHLGRQVATEEEPCSTAARGSEDTQSTPATAPADAPSSATEVSSTSTPKADAHTESAGKDTLASRARSGNAGSHDKALERYAAQREPDGQRIEGGRIVPTDR